MIESEELKKNGWVWYVLCKNMAVYIRVGVQNDHE